MSALAASPPHVVVVGGGIVGASIAWHLAQEQTNVTIVAEQVGGTATPNSFAWVNAAYGNPKFYFDLRHRSMAHWRELTGHGHGRGRGSGSGRGSCGPGPSHGHGPGDSRGPPVHWGGSVSWDLSPEELEDYLTQHSAWGYDIARVERSEIAALEPGLADDVLPAEWGVRVAEEGAAEAEAAALWFLTDAEAHGARIIEATAAGFLKEDDDKDGSGERIAGVVTAAGQEVRADHVVLAAGVGSVPLLAAEGVALPVTAVAGLLVHSRPSRRRLLNGVVYTAGLHLRQTLDGRILAGTDFSGGDPGADPARTAAEVFAEAQAALRGGAALELDYYTVGYRPTPRDGLPILGPTGLDGLSVAVMHSGVTNAAIVGQLLARQILTGETDPAFADFLLSRFDNATAAAAAAK